MRRRNSIMRRPSNLNCTGDMTLKLYLDVLSQPSRSVLIFCRAANIKHEFKPLRFAKNEHKTSEFAKISKFQTIPAIVDGDFAVRDSAAILRYLSRTRNVPDQWYPKDPVDQARVDEYLHWHHLNTRSPLMAYFMECWSIPLVTKTPIDLSKATKLEKGVTKCFDNIETLYLEGGQRKFLCGDSVNVADLQAACEIEQLQLAGLDVYGGRPILSSFLNRVKKEFNPHYDEVHTIMHQMRDKTRKLIVNFEKLKTNL